MPRDRPNILLLFTDQHRLSGLGCYGETVCRTPNIDRLAAEGVRFETAYTVCPVCSPARGTIMTGLYPHTHGICSNVHDLGNSIHELVDRPELLSRRLIKAGYQCGYSGKWHLGSNRTTTYGVPNTPFLPRDVGFEGQSFPGNGSGGFNHTEYQEYLASHGWEHKVRRLRPELIDARAFGVIEGPLESSVPYFLAENTISMMERMSCEQAPWFIWHSTWGPHTPYIVPQEFLEIYRDIEIPEWPNYRWPAAQINRPHRVKLHPLANQMTWDIWAEQIRHYYAFISHIDQQLGRILERLDSMGERENTVVIFTSDHGETAGSHGGLTDKGWHHFEEIQRIGWIVSVPNRWRAAGLTPGSVLQEWVSTLDLYPSICDWAGAEYDADKIRGLSLARLLGGQPVPWRDRAFVQFHGVNSQSTSMVSVRHGQLKYGWNCSNLDELYDLGEDPHEMRNLVDDPAYANALLQLRGMLAEWMAETAYPGHMMYIRQRLGAPRW